MAISWNTNCNLSNNLNNQLAKKHAQYEHIHALMKLRGPDLFSRGGAYRLEISDW